ncbi:uncharacterized protein [Anoplolepis gracilipes]|uniref:uncharacterized protein n=1 Tax=Anoplolepis gracilipes TaxID=354296 RepID=UPI003B9EF2A2
MPLPTTLPESAVAAWPELTRTEGYHFWVKESTLHDNLHTLVLSKESGTDLECLRTELKKKFGVPKNSTIFYIDDEEDIVPIDSECEFEEAKKLAKHLFDKFTAAVTLLVGGLNMLDNEENSWRYKNHSIKGQLNEQTESKNMDIQKQFNTSLECCSDALPPLWFTKYMELMKKDMVSTITDEVVKNVTNTLNKRLDSLVFSPLKESNQSESQYSSLTTHSQSSLNSNEKSQKKIKSQDKKQLSDVSTERKYKDKPRNANTVKNISLKKDVIATITNEVVKEMTELLDKTHVGSLISVPSKDPCRTQCLRYFPSSARIYRHPSDSHSTEKNQETIKSQDREQSNDNALMKMEDSLLYSKLLQDSTLHLQILGNNVLRIHAVNERMKKKQHQQIAQVITDDLIGDIGREKEQSVENNTQEDLISRQNLPNPKPSDEKVHLEALKLIENELRMNCSVTGHQMLDEGLLNRDICNTFDNNLLKSEKNIDVLSDNMTSFWSCDQEEKGEKEKEEDDDAFEIIQLPLTDEFLIKLPFKDSTIEQQHHDSNRDSPSFELLSEPPSPPCSIHLNEDHFSANEENPEQRSVKTNPPNSVFAVDVHGKIFNDEHQTVNLDERVNVDLQKQFDAVYSFTDEDFLLTEEDFLLTEDEDEEVRSKSPCAEHQSNERKNPRDEPNGSYDDVRNSHASYLTVQTHCDSKTQSQCSCQSQTDSGDFTQSFHSHTTSVTDTTDMYAHTYVNKYGDQVITTANDVREATTMATATPRSNHDVDIVLTKELRRNEIYRHDNKCPNNYPEYFCAPNNSCPCSRDPSFGRFSYQSCPYRTGRSSDKSCSNLGSRKTSASDQALLSTADSVHILPETLVSAAAQVGSFAYDTAREMFDKLRAHTKEDPLKRRGGVKGENKKSFTVSHLPFY